MQRRSFLKSSGLVLAGAPFLFQNVALAAAKKPATVGQGLSQKAVERLGVTSVCFRDWFVQTRPKGEPVPNRTMTLEQFPQYVVSELGLRNIEVWAAHFDDDTVDYARALKNAANSAGANIFNIQLDLLDYDLATTDEYARKKSIALVKKWMDLAVACGAQFVRANTDKPTPDRPFNATLIAESFRQLAEYGKTIGVMVLIENHGGYSSDIKNVVEVQRLVNDPNCKILADWGNSSATTLENRIVDLSQMFPQLALVSAKGLRFDAETYVHKDYDVGAITRATEDSGYKGIYSIELYVRERAEVPKDPKRAVQSMISAIAANIR